MDEHAQDIWAKAEGIPKDWPRDEQGRPEQAARLGIQWELDSLADITVSMLAGCGIPAFKYGSLGKILGGFVSQGVDIFVPVSRLEEAQALLASPADPSDQTPDTGAEE